MLSHSHSQLHSFQQTFLIIYHKYTTAAFNYFWHNYHSLFINLIAHLYNQSNSACSHLPGSLMFLRIPCSFCSLVIINQTATKDLNCSGFIIFFWLENLDCTSGSDEFLVQNFNMILCKTESERGTKWT